MPKYYFSELEIECCHIDYWKWYIKEYQIPELKLFKAKPDYGNGYFFCSHPDILEVGEAGHSDCGKFCKEYKPRNGKNGRCRHSNNTYDQTDKVKILKMK